MAKIVCSYGTNKLWIVEAAYNPTSDVPNGKTLVKTKKDKYITVRVLHEFEIINKFSKRNCIGTISPLDAIFNCRKMFRADCIGKKDVENGINVWTEELEGKYEHTQ